MQTPSAPARVILDTDTFNEVDDQFALAHLLLSPDRVRFEAVYAAPFTNQRARTPGEGMERSYEEIHRVLDLVPTPHPPAVFRGSTSYLPGSCLPVRSDAVNALIERAMATGEERLYVLAIAAITNIASALLVEPRIAEKITVVWLGGHAPYWPHTREFNLWQDLHAARVLLDTEVPLVLLPCQPVTSHIVTTVAELEQQLAPGSHLGAYLTDIVRKYEGNPPGWSKVIWDIAASAWMINPEWVKTEEAPSPLLQEDFTWGPSTGRRRIQIAREVNRDAILSDFFAKARGRGQGLPV